MIGEIDERELVIEKRIAWWGLPMLPLVHILLLASAIQLRLMVMMVMMMMWCRYPNSPGWIDKVYLGMWRGRQVILLHCWMDGHERQLTNENERATDDLCIDLQVLVKIPRVKDLKGKELLHFRKAVAKRIRQLSLPPSLILRRQNACPHSKRTPCRIAHPNVVSCLGACTAPGHFKVVEEMLDEGGFSRLLRLHRQSTTYYDLPPTPRH